MSTSRTMLLAAVLFAGSSIGCYHGATSSNRMPSATGTPVAQSSNGADVGNGTDTSGNGSPTSDPQQTETPRCPDPVPGQPRDPACEDRSPAPTTPDPHP